MTGHTPARSARDAICRLSQNHAVVLSDPAHHHHHWAAVVSSGWANAPACCHQIHNPRNPQPQSVACLVGTRLVEIDPHPAVCCLLVWP